MSIIGYARVSSSDQGLGVQEEALQAAGCSIIRSEKRSGTAIKGRDQLQTVLDFIHAGDVLVVTKLDRLARSVGDLSRIVETLAEKGASLRVLNANIDTSTASGKAFLGMLGVFAEFETNLRRERQLEGIAKAKKAGVYKGRPASIDAAAVRRLKDEGNGATEISKALEVSRASVYRVLAGKVSA
jgi:DNA invertase Pin-like site-specific DNA recombinase